MSFLDFFFSGIVSYFYNYALQDLIFSFFFLTYYSNGADLLQALVLFLKTHEHEISAHVVFPI